MKKIDEIQGLTHKIRALEIKRKKIVDSVSSKKIRVSMKAYIKSMVR